MIVCSTCRKEMTCVSTGVMVLFGQHHAYAGDEFKCKSCGNTTISTNSSNYHASDLAVEAIRQKGKLREIK